MTRNIALSEGEFYHVYNRGIDKRNVYLNNKDYERFLSLLYVCNSNKPIHISDYQNTTLGKILTVKRGDVIVEIISYCLMPNHFHLLIRENKVGGISLFMQKILTGYTMYFNRKNDRSGSLFESTFKAKHVESDEYLKYLYAYIHLNPVKLIDSKWKENGIKDKEKAKKFLLNYAYSSYQDYIGIKRVQNSILTTGHAPEYFNEKNSFSKLVSYWLSYNKEE